MPKVSMSAEFKVPADKLWEAIGRGAATGAWHPGVAAGPAGGEGERRLKLAGGGELVERLERVSETERLYAYSVVGAAFSVADYSSEIRVRDTLDGNSTVVWSSEFAPLGTSETDVARTIEAMYRAGFDNLRKMFGA